MKEKYINIKRLKRDVKSEVIAAVREDFDAAVDELIDDIEESQRSLESETKIFIALCRTLAVVLAITVIVLSWRIQTQQKEIEDLKTLVSVNETNIRKHSIHFFAIEQELCDSQNIISKDNHKISEIQQSIDNINHDIDYVYEAANLGIRVEPNDDSSTGPNSPWEGPSN